MKNLTLVHAMTVENGTIVNPLTKTVVGKIVEGNLDVMRPGNKMPRPQNVAATEKNIGEVFANWYLVECYVAPVTAEEVAAALGIEYKAHPKHPGTPKTQPIALATAEYGDDTLIFVYIGGSLGRVGLLRDKSVLWAYSQALLAKRPDVCPKNTKATDTETLFRIIMRSFTGSFAHRAAHPVKTTTSAKSAPTPVKTTNVPRKLPAKKGPPTVAAK